MIKNSNFYNLINQNNFRYTLPIHTDSNSHFHASPRSFKNDLHIMQTNAKKTRFAYTLFQMWLILFLPNQSAQSAAANQLLQGRMLCIARLCEKQHTARKDLLTGGCQSAIIYGREVWNFELLYVLEKRDKSWF